MKRSRHPEYQVYVQATEASRLYRSALAAWQESGISLVVRLCSGNEHERPELRWTFDEAFALARALSDMMQAYNRVLWEQFPYCEQCRGGCCTLAAMHLTSFDWIALALLNHEFPTLPEYIAAEGQDCIYRTAQGCAWPREWRPLKCSLFYCTMDAPSAPLTGELERAIWSHLPSALRNYEAIRGERLTAYLEDPIRLYHAFDRALSGILVTAIEDRYALEPGAYSHTTYAQDQPHQQRLLETLALIGNTMERFSRLSPADREGLSILAEQIMADLETLEWIALGHPEQEPDLLRAMHLRYSDLSRSGEGPNVAIWRELAGHITELLRESDGSLS